MSAIGSAHAACVDLLTALLTEASRRRFIVRGQNPVRLDEFSEPQPDIALVAWRDDFYRQAHPTPADVLLVIEVADSTVESDRAYKLPLYAKAGISEVWFVNLPAGRIEIYTDPEAGAYRTTRHARRGEEAQAQAVPGLSVSADAVLG